MPENIIIIGSGPAGYTAAIYAGRAQLAPVLFEGTEPGGQLTTTSEIENFPGFTKGITGTELMNNFKEQAEKFGTTILTKAVTKVDFHNSPQPPLTLIGGTDNNPPLKVRGGAGGVMDKSFKIWCGDELYESKAVIISTGASAQRLGLKNEKLLYGKGVSACATCDGFFFKNKTVVVVGGGDTAMEEATFLTKFASKVYVIHRKDTLRASKPMQERAMNNPKVAFIWNTVVEDILGVDVGHVTGVTLRNLVTKELSNLSCDGLFAAIGHKPNTELFQGQLELDQKGYIAARPGTTLTSVDGVFAAGDCVDHKYRQAITAAGTGCQSAIDAERWLETQK